VSAARALSFAFALSLLVACGGGGGAPSAPVEDIPVPVSFATATGVGAVVLTRRTRDPETLLTPRCDLQAWLARAAEGTQLERLDEEGACLLLAADPQPASYSPALEPACAGAFRVAYGPAARAITFCDVTTFPAPLSVDCAEVAMAPAISASSLPDELPGDELASLDLQTPMPALPTIVMPASQGEGMALWPVDGVRVRWAGAAASSVEVVLRARPAGATELHCFVDDSGDFTLPERLVAPFRASRVSLEVLRNSVDRATADGFDVRLSARVSDAIWLSPPAAP